MRSTLGRCQLIGLAYPLLDQVRWCAVHCDINPRILSLCSLEPLAAELMLIRTGGRPRESEAKGENDAVEARLLPYLRDRK